MLLINGEPQQTPAIDRGLLYGDGLFETMRLVEGRVPLWSRHWRRLSYGMRKLGMPFDSGLAMYVRDQFAHLSHCQMARLTVTRANQGRGYAPDKSAVKVYLQGFESAPKATVKHLQIIHHALSEQPALVECKHLNRLDQVIASSELAAPFDDGVMFDQRGNVTCTTVGNLFVWDGEQLITPILDRSGIQGVMRSVVLDSAKHVKVPTKQVRIQLDDLYNAKQIWVSNAVRGLTPVVQLAQQRWSAQSPLPELFNFIEEVRHGRQVI